MKCILFVLLLIQGYTYAQHAVRPQPGAEWEICRSTFLMEEQYTITTPIRYENDTIINNKLYQITSRQSTSGQIMIEYLTRFEQDTIFRYVNGYEYMFFTYNVLVGDTLFPLRTGVIDYNEDTCSYSLELLCLDIYPVTIDGNVLNLYEFVDVGTSGYGTNGSGQTTKYYWIEIIGWVSRFPWLIIESEEFCNEAVMDVGLEFPIYYTDSTRSWPIEFQEYELVCDTSLSAGLEHVKNFSIHPIPTSGKITFSLGSAPTNNSSIVITDLQGRIVKTVAITQKEKQIDLDLVVDGVYLIHLVENRVIQATKKLIYVR